MTFSDPRSHSEPLLKSLRLLKFSDIIHLEILSFVYQWYHKLSPSCFVNYFNPVSSIHSYNTRQSQIDSGAPARAQRARSGAPWVRKFGKPSIPENLVMTQRTPVRTHTSCKPISTVTIDLAQLDQPLCYVSHPYEYDQIDSCQNQTCADNYHMTVSRAQINDQSFCPYI